jgi:hypothetical protein
LNGGRRKDWFPWELQYTREVLVGGRKTSGKLFILKIHSFKK